MKIYDCFTFFNEFDLLDIRLNTLSDHVDKFVIVEGERTFQNKPKELLLKTRPDIISRFEDKIIYIVVKEKDFVGDAWENEKNSFNKIKDGLTSCDAEDLVLVGAIDEIPNPSILQSIKSTDVFERLNFGKNNGFHLQMKLFYFYLNTKFREVHFSSSSSWVGTYLSIYNNLQKTSDLYQEAVKKRKLIPVIVDGGWHFSFLGDGKTNVKKINSYSHSEFNFLTEDEIEKNMFSLKDPLGRTSDINQTVFDGFEPIENLPIYIQNNLEKFKHLIRLN